MELLSRWGSPVLTPGTNKDILPVGYSPAHPTHPAHFSPLVGFHPQPRGVLVFNACVFIFAIAQAIPDPTLSPVLFDPQVSGVQSGTFHSLPPLNSFPAAQLLKPGAICQPQRVLMNTRGPGPCDLATHPKKGRGQSPVLAMFSLQGLLEGEGELFFLAFFLSFFSWMWPSWDTPGCLSPPLPQLIMTASARTTQKSGELMR